ncbi:chaperonin 10-like protein [Talaromyces proteolyticus]|uniref:Chaperonin 10-like protein n=1 Tax=Talaromyces proteolyticus TaxID=1131652 RepID=A0AAD4KX32_9EURO|nr:chaperonin 10-like protein [Talaromyces proteolyticus]KAH8698782.1 chaperonin 10-like protein [Talaromyces proteolyticus]
MFSAATTMKALRLTREPEGLTPAISLTTLPIPKAIPGYAVVRIHYSAINPSDRLNSKGLFPHTTFPIIPGRDFSGVVVAGSPNKIGMEVYGTSGGTLGFSVDGPHAEYCLLPENGLVRKPKQLSFLQAATVGVPYTAAFLCLRRARMTENDVVLVLGATGAVGSAAVQLSKALKCKQVISAFRGVDADIDLTADPNLTTVQKLTNGKGVDVVVDTVGNLDLMKSAVNQLAHRGRYTWISAPRNGASTELNFDVFQGYRQEIELIGCNTASYTFEDVATDLTKLGELFDKGEMTAKADGDFDTISLEEAVEKGYKSNNSQKHQKQIVIHIGPEH